MVLRAGALPNGKAQAPACFVSREATTTSTAIFALRDNEAHMLDVVRLVFLHAVLMIAALIFEFSVRVYVYLFIYIIYVRI